MLFQLHRGDCIEVMRSFADSSVDAIVTDPPYGLSFMAKHWDYDVPSVDIWRECLRVLKPGGHLLAFAGTRTQHRMAVNIEDAGFEIRDMIAWVYGSGFPKSKNLDGNWQGWGTALKPALEPITVARKPLVGTVAENVIAHGTGAINVDGCRVRGRERTNYGLANSKRSKGSTYGTPSESADFDASSGRWPANLIHDGSEEVVDLFPDSDGAGPSLPNVKITGYGDGVVGSGKSDYLGGPRRPFNSGSGSAARFFYCAKANKKDRDSGLDRFDEKRTKALEGGRIASAKTPDSPDGERTGRNNHPTVKPTDLMRYLCRLVTPTGGVVLDPFMGSGSTGKAVMLEGFRFIGIERELEYLDIAKARILTAQIEAFDTQIEVFDREECEL